MAESGLTRKKLAEKMGVSYASVDNWLDGKTKPTPANISLLGRSLAEFLPGETSSSMTKRIRLQFALAEIGDRLATRIGRDTVIELAAALYRFVWLMTKDVDRMNRPPIEEAIGIEFDTFRLGTDEREAHTLLRNIELDVEEPEWKSYILAAAGDWQVTFEAIASQAVEGGGAAGLAQDLYDRPSLSDEQIEIETSATQQLKKIAPTILDGPLQDILSRRPPQSPFSLLEFRVSWRRQIVEKHPQSANAHFNLGSFLGMAAKHMHNPQYLEEGISECHIAATLVRDWDAPLVEPAIMLANVGHFDRALGELSHARTGLPEPTPHYEYCLGYVLMNLGRLQEALDAYERVIAAAPAYALALEDAARCAFQIGDKKKGRRYAKRANRVGRPQAYHKWRRGDYRSSRRTPGTKSSPRNNPAR